MSEFRNLPQSFIAHKNEELLLVTPTEATRISVRSLQYDSFALLKFSTPADQGYGIGTADVWVNIPFNVLDDSGSIPWVTLNADGSFVLAAGCYKLACELSFYATNNYRIGLLRQGSLTQVVGGYASNTVGVSSKGSLHSRIDLQAQETISLKIAVASPSGVALYVNDSFLAGQQATAAHCEIHKLG